MANYASLRGPVGHESRVRPVDGTLSADTFLAELKAGRGVATNGALLYLKAGDSSPGDTVSMPKSGTLEYRATLRANFPVDHLELVWNGAVVAKLSVGADDGPRTSAARFPSRRADGCCSARGTRILIRT